MLEIDEMPKRKRAYSYIRFSSPEQARGHSLERQLAAAKEYAERHNLELDETFTVRDLGISAFRGLNRRGGALRTFLDGVQDGKIEEGSVLLVESLDRLSRQELEQSFPFLFDIVNAGVQVHTLSDNRIYRKGHLTLVPQHLHGVVRLHARPLEPIKGDGMGTEGVSQSVLSPRDDPGGFGSTFESEL